MESRHSEIGDDRPPHVAPVNGADDAGELVSTLYEALRQLARRSLIREPRTPTVQPTDLVHAAFLRLAEDPKFRWKDRAYVFSAAAEAIRRILVERARRRRRVRHGGHLERVAYRSDLLLTHRVTDFLALDQAIEELEARDPRKATIVKLRYVIGMTIEETAGVLGLSPTTVKEDWLFSRAWLHRRMNGPAAPRADVRASKRRETADGHRSNAAAQK
jgi:RNA polymerase sigma factor (TIGR02999 family)